MTAEGRDTQGERCGYYAADDRIAEPGSDTGKPGSDTDKQDGGSDKLGGTGKPAEGRPAGRRTVLECGPCASLQLYLYVIPHCLPALTDTQHTPPIPVRLKVTCDGKALLSEQIEINAWGGYSGYFEWKE